MNEGLKAILEVLVLVPGVLIVAFVATRLLGVRRSWLATGTSVIIGIVLGGMIALVIADGHPEAHGFVRNTLALSFVMTMVAAVAADLLAKPGSLAKGQQAGLFVVPRPIKSIRNSLDEVRRTREILRIVADNGFAPALGIRSRRRRREAAARAPVEERLRTALEECGGMFVKLGQMASTRSDILPPNLIDVLSHLQSQVAPEPADAMRELVEEELGASVDEVFAAFEWQPVAAASIGQVYFATLRTGELVVVKAQRPRVADLVERDSKVLLRLAQSVERNTPFGKEYRVYELAQEFCRGLAEELDFRIEANNTTVIRQNMEIQPGIRVPKIYDEYSTSRLMVQERLIGVTAADNDRIAALGVDRDALAEKLLRAALAQMMTDGFFHADLHPGNVMVLSDDAESGSLGMIDFGSTGRLDPLMQASLRQMLISVGLQDAAMLRQAVSEVTEISADVDQDALERALSRFMAVHVTHGGAINASAVADLMQLLTQFGIRVPVELTTFSRALVILEGTLSTLAPGYKLSDHAQTIASEWASEQMAPGSMEELLQNELISLLPTLRQLPRRADRVGEMLERGSLSTRVSLFSSEADTDFVSKMVNRATLAFIGAVLGVISAILLASQGSPDISDNITLLHFFGYIGLACASVLMLRVIAAIVRDGFN